MYDLPKLLFPMFFIAGLSFAFLTLILSIWWHTVDEKIDVTGDWVKRNRFIFLSRRIRKFGLSSMYAGFICLAFGLLFWIATRG